ncbi:bfr2 protein [Spatholobus suberectus]|nr:bfr2 protein [Spatholobus suberectus]
MLRERLPKRLATVAGQSVNINFDRFSFILANPNGLPISDDDDNGQIQDLMFSDDYDDIVGLQLPLKVFINSQMIPCRHYRQRQVLNQGCTGSGLQKQQ